MNFAGKRALVTGAAGGIGGSITSMLRSAGARVAVTDRNTDGIDAEAHFPGDLTDPSYTNTLPVQAAEALGGLDILINNAGLMRRGKVTDSSDEDFDISVAVNVKAPFQLCRAAIPIMAAIGGGAIVNTASCWGVHPGPDHAVYCDDQSRNCFAYSMHGARPRSSGHSHQRCLPK